jgi:hypothetical protein
MGSTLGGRLSMTKPVTAAAEVTSRVQATARCVFNAGGLCSNPDDDGATACRVVFNQGDDLVQAVGG